MNCEFRQGAYVDKVLLLLCGAFPPAKFNQGVFMVAATAVTVDPIDDLPLDNLRQIADMVGYTVPLMPA